MRLALQLSGWGFTDLDNILDKVAKMWPELINFWGTEMVPDPSYDHTLLNRRAGNSLELPDLENTAWLCERRTIGN